MLRLQREAISSLALRADGERTKEEPSRAQREVKELLRLQREAISSLALEGIRSLLYPCPMAIIWFLLLALAFASAALGGSMDGLTQGAFQGAEGAITLAIALAGILALWMGMLRIAEEAGLTGKLAGLVRPLLSWLFPDVPKDHPAMTSMALNVSANALGLGNAATPMGLKAMEQLQALNPDPKVASDAMILFLVINTSSVQIIPATVIALRAAGGAENPAAVVGPTLLATAISTVVGVLAAKLLARLGRESPALELAGDP